MTEAEGTKGRIQVGGHEYSVRELEDVVEKIYEKRVLDEGTPELLLIAALAAVSEEPTSFRAAELRRQARQLVGNTPGLGVEYRRSWRADNAKAKEIPVLQVAQTETDLHWRKSCAVHFAQPTPETKEAMNAARVVAERALVQLNEAIQAAQDFETRASIEYHHGAAAVRAAQQGKRP